MDSEFPHTFGPDAGVLRDMSGNVEIPDGEGTGESKPLLGDLGAIFRDDFIGAVNNAHEVVDEDGVPTKVYLFSAKGTGTGVVPMLSHTPKLRVDSASDQAIDEMEDAVDILREALLPGITQEERFGTLAAEGGGYGSELRSGEYDVIRGAENQGLEGELEKIRDKYFDPSHKDTKEEEIAPITEETRRLYIEEVTRLFIRVSDRGIGFGKLSIIPAMEREKELSERATERSEEARHREPTTAKGFGAGGVPRSKIAGEEVDSEGEIVKPKETGFSLGEQQIDIPITNVERAPESSISDTAMVRGRLWAVGSTPEQKREFKQYRLLRDEDGTHTLEDTGDTVKWRRYRRLPTGEEEEVTDEITEPSKDEYNKRIYTGNAPPPVKKFDPSKSVPLENHDTVADDVISNARKTANGKREGVVTDPAKLTPMAPITQESTGMSPAEVSADWAAKKLEVEARMAPKQQGTDDGS